MLFLQYPKCSTCQKAKKFLVANDVSFEDRNIVENNPTKEELQNFLNISNIPIKKFFNTNGRVYKELNLKDKINNITIDEALDLLSSNGMLVKRPILVTKSTVLIGFKEDEWNNAIK